MFWGRRSARRERVCVCACASMRSPGTGNCENRDDFFPPSLFVHSPRRRLKLRLAIDSNFTLSFSPNTGSDDCVPTHTLWALLHTLLARLARGEVESIVREGKRKLREEARREREDWY